MMKVENEKKVSRGQQENQVQERRERREKYGYDESSSSENDSEETVPDEGVEREPEGDNAATDNHGNGVLTGIFGSQDRTTSEIAIDAASEDSTIISGTCDSGDFTAVTDTVYENIVDNSSPILPSDEQCSLSSSASENSSTTSCSSEGTGSDSDSELCLKDFEAHYLEPDPAAEEELDDGGDYPPPLNINEDHGNDSDPDDPIEPNGGYDMVPHEVEDSSDSEDSNDEHDNQEFLNHHSLLRNFQILENFSVGDSLILTLAKSVRHNWTFVTIIDILKSKNLECGAKFFPTSKQELWNVIKKGHAKFVAYAYCGRKGCGKYLGKLVNQPDEIECECGEVVTKDKVRFFITLDIVKQLQYFLSIPGIANILNYPQRRVKRGADTIEDIFDGECYKRLKEEGGPLFELYQFSYVLNTDGCKLSKGAKLTLWPVFIRLNELPPGLRQKFSFLAAIYVDYGDPNFNSLLKPLRKQLNKLSTTGVVWKPDGINEVRSRFHPTCFCVDAVARNEMLNTARFNSHFGCAYCTHKGVYGAGSMRYPILPHDQIPPYERRTGEGMERDMRLATVNEEAYENQETNGHKGMTELALIDGLSLSRGCASDDLHPVDEGTVAHHIELILRDQQIRIPRGRGIEDLMSAIDARLLKIKTPSIIARKPSSIGHRAQWHGTEFRNFLQYYFPCLEGLVDQTVINHLSKLSHAMYLLSQDVITPRDLQVAERFLTQYVTTFEQKYGVNRMRFNVHALTHLTETVRNWGSFNCYSTYNFESLNRHLMEDVTSPQGASIQIATRTFIRFMVHCAMFNEDLDLDVRTRLKEILNKDMHRRARQFGEHVYLLGKVQKRRPNLEEAEALAREGMNTNELNVYKRVLVGRTRYYSRAAHKQHYRSDDTFICTWQNSFCTICDIVLLINEQGEEECGVFVSKHDVYECLVYARHMWRLKGPEHDSFSFVRISDVRCPSMKIPVDEKTYATPVSSQSNID